MAYPTVSKFMNKHILLSNMLHVIVMLFFVTLFPSLPPFTFDKGSLVLLRKYDNQQSGIMLKYAYAYAPSTYLYHLFLVCMIKVIKAQSVNCYSNPEEATGKLHIFIAKHYG